MFLFALFNLYRRRWLQNDWHSLRADINRDAPGLGAAAAIRRRGFAGISYPHTIRLQMLVLGCWPRAIAYRYIAFVPSLFADKRLD